MNTTAAEVAITQRSSAQSPLLRLPGEVRNIIYDYATGHYNIYHTSGGHLILGSVEPLDWRHAFVEFPSVSDLLPLTLVCCQTYLETRLHVFTNNIFDTKNFFYFRRRMEKLTATQKSAITTIMCSLICMGNIGFNVSRLTNTIDPTEPFLIQPYLDLLPAFAGLKRVVIDSSKMITQGNDEYAKAMEDCAVFSVWRFFKKDGMLVEFIRGRLFRLR